MSGVFAGISTSGETLGMLFNNDGKRTGAINRLWLTVLYKKDNEERLFSIYPHTKDDGAIYLQPGKTIGTQFLLANSVIHWRPENAATEDLQTLATVDFWNWNTIKKDTTCYVSLLGVNADGSKFEDKLNIDCAGQAFQMFRKLAGEVNK